MGLRARYRALSNGARCIAGFSVDYIVAAPDWMDFAGNFHPNGKPADHAGTGCCWTVQNVALALLAVARACATSQLCASGKSGEMSATFCRRQRTCAE